MDFTVKRALWEEIHCTELLEEWAGLIRFWQLIGAIEQEMETYLWAKGLHPDSRRDIIEEVMRDSRTDRA